MPEIGIANGEARTAIKVIERGLQDCQHNCAEAAERNREDHQEVFRRLNGLEIGVGQIAARVSFWAAAGGMIGTGLIGVVWHLLKQ